MLKIKKGLVGYLLLIAVVAEIIFFGGGRLIEIGPITFRMILFTLSQMYIASILFRSKVKPYVIALVLFFMCSLTFSAALGLTNNADLEFVIADIKSTSYFIMLIFFHITIKNKQTIISLTKTIKVCTFILATTYIATLISILFGYLDYHVIYKFMEGNSEFIISEGRLFYKGFLYLCIGFIFFSVDKSIFHRLISVLFAIAIIFTFTRGFLLATTSVYILYLTLFTPFKVKKLIALSAIAAILIMLSTWYFENLGPNRSAISDLPRITTLNQVTEAITFSSFFIGHGLGVGVKERLDRMEMSYVEILHKQGIVGLLFWITLPIIIIIKYRKINNKSDKLIALPFLLSTILVYIQTATNPYLNNPIGMTIVLLALAVVNVLRGNRGIEHKAIPIGETSILSLRRST